MPSASNLSAEGLPLMLPNHLKLGHLTTPPPPSTYPFEADGLSIILDSFFQ